MSRHSIPLSSVWSRSLESKGSVNDVAKRIASIQECNRQLVGSCTLQITGTLESPNGSVPTLLIENGNWAFHPWQKPESSVRHGQDQIAFRYPVDLPHHTIESVKHGTASVFRSKSQTNRKLKCRQRYGTHSIEHNEKTRYLEIRLNKDTDLAGWTAKLCRFYVGASDLKENAETKMVEINLSGRLYVPKGSSKKSKLSLPLDLICSEELNGRESKALTSALSLLADPNRILLGACSLDMTGGISKDASGSDTFTVKDKKWVFRFLEDIAPSICQGLLDTRSSRDITLPRDRINKVICEMSGTSKYRARARGRWDDTAKVKQRSTAKPFIDITLNDRTDMSDFISDRCRFYIASSNNGPTEAGVRDQTLTLKLIGRLFVPRTASRAEDGVAEDTIVVAVRNEGQELPENDGSDRDRGEEEKEEEEEDEGESEDGEEEMTSLAEREMADLIAYQRRRDESQWGDADPGLFCLP